jgi:hypothetical protein
VTKVVTKTKNTAKKNALSKGVFCFDRLCFSSKKCVKTGRIRTRKKPAFSKKTVAI